jgi:hypothetical protein
VREARVLLGGQGVEAVTRGIVGLQGDEAADCLSSRLRSSGSGCGGVSPG